MGLRKLALCTGLVFLGITFVCCQSEDASRKLKFLFYTGAEDGSHHMQNTNIARGLLRRGHNVTFLLSSSCTKWLHTKDAHLFDFIIYKSSYTPDERQEISRQFSRSVMNGQLRSAVGVFKLLLNATTQSRKTFVKFFLSECDDLLGDTEALEALEASRFDMLVGDDLPMCHALLAQKLQLRFVLYGSTAMKPSKLQMLYGMPHYPSFVPERQLSLTDDMSLPQRILNTVMSAVYTGLYHLQMTEYSRLQNKYKIVPKTSTTELMGRAELWVISMDFVLEFSRPVSPNIILIAHSSVGVPQENVEVPVDQQEFVDGGREEGVVLFSLGTHVTELTNERAGMFARGLARLPQRVMWHYAGNASKFPVGNNTKIVRWMPMQTFMAHPNIKAMICHGGSGMLYEALWFGLPVVGIPLFGDQFDNMIRAVHKGLAISIGLFEMTEDALHEAVSRVIEDPSFKENAKKTSGILRDDVLIPPDKAAHWIIHVTRFGGGHLKPKFSHLSFFQRNLLDVCACFTGFSLFVFGLAVIVCRHLCCG